MLVEKQQNKKRKLYHFTDLINEFNFYDLCSFKYKKFKGCLYYLDNPDEKQLKHVIEKYQNTKIFHARSAYAPEQVKTCLFIAQ